MAESGPNLSQDPDWFNEEIAQWIDALVGKVAECTEGMHSGITWSAWADTGGGEHWEFNEKTWIVISIFEVLREFVGGKEDGTQHYVGCLWHVSPILELFDEPGKVELLFDADLNTNKGIPTIDIEGEIGGRPTTFRLLSEPPEHTEPQINVYPDGSFCERDDPEEDDEDDEEDD